MGHTEEIVQRLHVVVAVVYWHVARAAVELHDLDTRESLSPSIHAIVAQLLVRTDLAQQTALLVDRESSDRERFVELKH